MKQKNKKMPESVEYASYDDNKIPVNNPILNYIYNHTEFKFINLSPYLFSFLLGLGLSTGEPWWFSKFDLESKYIGIVFLLFGIIILILAIIMIGYLIYFRSVKKLNMLSVEMKEIVRYIFKECFDTKRHKAKTKKAKEKIINALCQKIINYFKILKRSNDTDKVGAAIRLAVCDKSNKIEFKTYTRSNLDSGREHTSQGIPADKGIPNFFSIKGNSGVLIFNDMDKAHEDGVFLRTKNDEIYKGEIKSLIVIPLIHKENAKMIGLLYITSSRYNYFDIKDKSHLETFAYLISMTIDFLQIEINTIYI